MKAQAVELSTGPARITVTPFGSSFNVRCDLCEPRRIKSINWNPNRRPVVDRCVDYLVDHLRGSHGLNISKDIALGFVNRATPQKATIKSEEAETRHLPFSPHRVRL
jgi:hypothetical protein